MMVEPQVSKSSVRWRGLPWFLPVAFLLLVIGIWVGFPWGATALLVASPVAVGLLVDVIGGKRTRTSGHTYSINSQWARSEGKLTVALPIGSVSQAVEDMCRERAYLSVVSLSETGAELTRRMNFWTWGERITMDFISVTAEETEIVAQCKPKLGTTLIDYRQGAMDLREIFEAIQRHASRDEPMR